VAKKPQSPKPDVGIAIVYKSILESAQQKAIAIMGGYLGDHAVVTADNCYEIADKLPDDAELRIKNAIGFLCCLEGFFDCVEAGEQRAGDLLIYAFELGNSAAYVELEAEIPAGIDGVLGSYQKHQAAATKGGRKSKRLTVDQEKLTLKIIEKKKSAGVSKTAACTRAAAELLKNHQIEVSTETLLRLLRK